MLIDESKVSCQHAKQVLAILAQGYYFCPDKTKVSIAAWQKAAQNATQLYGSDEIDTLFNQLLNQFDESEDQVNVVLMNASTQFAAQSFASKTKLVLLNFASARNPGGGFISGANAQEEELCRCSGLYPTLLTQAEYYQINRQNNSLLYGDHLIYSPNVPFFRLSKQSSFLSQAFLASVITAPAANAGAIAKKQPQLIDKIEETFLRRWRKVLTVAAATEHKTLILGAWGCGAFQNNAEMVANTVATVLKSKPFNHFFDTVVFAIPNKGKRSKKNFEAFQTILAKYFLLTHLLD